MTARRSAILFLLLLLLVPEAPRASLAAAPEQALPLAPRQGVLLVADKSIADPRFAQSVILLVRHDMNYTAGLIINKPAPILPSDLVPPLPDILNRLYYGGPVRTQAPHLLFRSPNPPAGLNPVIEDIYYADLSDISSLLPALKDGRAQLRAFFGYAGWAAGQLAREIARGDWHLLPADATSVFSPDPEDLWSHLYPGSDAVWI